MKKYILYYRVSTKTQGESGMGLKSQVQYLSHYIKKNEVVKTFTENATAKNYDCRVRPLLCEAISLCIKHGYILAVAKIDRLSRNLKDAVNIYEDLKGKIFSCDIPSADGKIDKFMFQMFIAFAERERELISLRTKNALTEVKKIRGEWRKGKFTEIDRQKGITANHLRKSENQNNIRAKELISLYRNKGKTLQEIATILNEKKFLSAHGKEFSPMQVRRLL